MKKLIILTALVLMFINVDVVKAEEIELHKHWHAIHFYDRGNDCYVISESIFCVKRNKGE